MNSKNHDLTEFEELITELENPEVRPYAPNLPRQTKEEMRHTLFTPQEDGLSRRAVMNLWKFAGTAVAAILLMFIVASFISAISNPSTQAGPQENVVSPPQRTPHAPTPDEVSADVTATDSPDLLNRTITFDDHVQVIGYELQSQTEGIKLRLQWRPLDIVDDRIQLFIHFIRENGEIVLQADSPLTEDMTLISSEPEDVFEGNLFVPTSDLSNGRYDIIVGLYNTETGERLPVSAGDAMLVTDGGTAVQIGSWSTHDLQDRIWLISVSPDPFTKLYDTDGVPTTFTFEIGYELVSAESAYLDSSLQPFGEGELPHYVSYSATADEDPRHKISQGVGSATIEMTMTSTRVDGLAEAVTAQIWLSLPDKRITLPPATLEELVWPLTPPEADNSGIQFGDALRLNAVESFHLNNRITASLYLVPLQEDLPDYVVALTVTDRNGVLVERLYQPLRDDSSMWTVNEPFYGEYEFVLPNALPNGVYQSWLGLYNTDTGMIGTELLLETWVQEGGWDPASVAPLTVSADRISDLILYQQPDGEPYDILLDETVSLILTFVDSDELVNDGNTAWIPLQFTSQETNEPLRGWVPLDIYNRIKAFALDIQDPTAEPQVESGSVWLVSLTQKERPSVDSPIELEVNMGYEFVSDEEVFLKLLYADPGWAGMSGGRLPIDGLGNNSSIILDENRGEVTINATLHPNEAMQIVGNENPVVVAQLGYIDEYRRYLNLLANVTFSQYPLDLTATEEIQYQP